MTKLFKKILVANRSEIATRIFRSATELGIPTVAIYSYEDRFALHRFKADEAYQIGTPGNPVKSYLDIDAIIQLAKKNGVDAIHPGYGFLSENSHFALACEKNNIKFIGPSVKTLQQLSDKVSARNIANKAGVATIDGSQTIESYEKATKVADDLGYPLMIKASFGGGGRGMRIARNAQELKDGIQSAQQEALVAFGNSEIFIEKYVENARHIEVQILADQANTYHLFERDCSIQRRHQKVIESAPARFLDEKVRAQLHEAAIKIAEASDYINAGTVEFLYDVSSKNFYFIEVNPRIQVEHTVTEEVTGIDLIKSQILVASGFLLNDPKVGITDQESISVNGYAIQSRITTEDPERDFQPDHGKITHYRSAAGFGVRLDAGSAFSGAKVTPYYDSLLVKVTAHDQNFENAVAKMTRSLQEFRIRGLKTNIPFLLNVMHNKDFLSGNLNTRFIDSNPDLFKLPKRKDRATKILSYLGQTIVNTPPNIEVRRKLAPLPKRDLSKDIPKGSRDRFLVLGAEDFCKEI